MLPADTHLDSPGQWGFIPQISALAFPLLKNSFASIVGKGYDIYGLAIKSTLAGFGDNFIARDGK